MNNVAILPHLCLYLLQNQNIKRNMVNVVKSNNDVEDTKNNVENKIHPGNKITPSSNEIIKQNPQLQLQLQIIHLFQWRQTIHNNFNH